MVDQPAMERSRTLTVGQPIELALPLAKSGIPVILHVFSTFAVGGPQVRFAALVNSPPHAFRHLVFAVDGRYDCLDRIHAAAGVEVMEPEFPRAGTASNVIAAGRALRRLRPDLLVTYNWGAIEWALAAAFTSTPYLHIVDGFGPEEADRQLARRVWFRRLALARCARTVVPSQTLWRLARQVWRLPADRLAHIPNGIDVDRFARQPDARLIENLGIRRDRPIIGTLATLRPEKNISRLLRAVAEVAARAPVVLVVAGEGPERRALETQAAAMGFAEDVIFTGAIDDPARILGAFDLFALSSDTEQMPVSVIEAMAAGLPVASVDVGDVKAMVTSENRPFVVERRSTALAGAICDLLSHHDARRRIGAANRDRARQLYTFDRMAGSYTQLYKALVQAAP
jgi:glycosyltransferase involved in cell wall biosynthesis